MRLKKELWLVFLAAFFLAGCSLNQEKEMLDKIKSPLGLEEKQEEKVVPASNKNEEYKQIALDYLTGKPVLAAASIGIFPVSERITSSPSSYSFKAITMSYDPVKDEYLLPVVAPPEAIQDRLEERELKVVVFDYDEFPYHAEVTIDILNNKVTSWETGQR